MWAYFTINTRGNTYFLLLVNDFSRYMWISLLKTKDEALEALKGIKMAAEIEVNLKFEFLQTDREGEFTTKEVETFCDKHGIKHFLTAPYLP